MTVKLCYILNSVGGDGVLSGDGYLTVIRMCLGQFVGASVITRKCQGPQLSACFMQRRPSSDLARVW